jgi:hypothetical protein
MADGFSIFMLPYMFPNNNALNDKFSGMFLFGIFTSAYDLHV